MPNLLIEVKCSSMGIDDTLLVSEVEYTAGPEGFESAVTLVNKEAHQ